MATGYETRQSGRDTFASQGPAVQRLGRGTSQGVHRDIQLVGGDAVAGGAPNANVTAPGRSDLGAFFTEALKPYVERKQQMKFFEGFTRAQSGEAIEELSRSHKSVVGQVLGPTSLEQGAQFYTAMKTVDDWQSDMLGRMDELKKLSPTEQAKHLADASLSLMGEDPYVNQMVQKQLIEKSGPLVDTINKKRYIWQQDTFRQGMFDALDSGADSLQAIASQIKDVSAPTDDETAAMQVSRSSFLGLMQRPEGMSDETYKATLSEAMQSFAQRGNYYAYSALEEAGVFQVLDDEDEEKVIAAYDRHSSKALDEAKGNYIEDLLRIREKREKGQMSAIEAVAGVDAINANISRDTGIRKRAYDSSFLLSEGTSVIEMIAAQARRQEERDYQAKVKAAEKAADAADEERAAQQDYSAAVGALNLGQPKAGIAFGIKPQAVNQAYHNAYKGGFFNKFALAWKQEQYINSDVANKMQAKVTSGGGVAYTGEVKQGYEEWKKLYAQNNAAAAAYYGTQHAKMIAMHDLVNSGVDATMAYTRSFGPDDGGRFNPNMLRPEKRRETTEALRAQVKALSSSKLSYMLGFGTRPMGPRAEEVIAGASAGQAAILQRTPGLNPEEVAEQAVANAKANGTFEYFGGNMAWPNRSGTKPIADIIGTGSDNDTGAVLEFAIDEQLKAAGVQEGAKANYLITRTPTTGNGFVLTVSLDDHRAINITSQELRGYADKAARGEIQTNTDRANRPKVGKVSWGS